MFIFAVYLMIGEEKRRRILELWRAGHTKKAIASMASVSVPSVRKYIRESETERSSVVEQMNGTYFDRIFGMERTGRTPVPIVVKDYAFPPGTRFIVNLGLPSPYSNNDPWTCLRNGVPIFDLENVLGKVMAPDTVSKVLEGIKLYGSAGKKYEVIFVYE